MILNILRFILGLIPGIGMLFFLAIMMDLCSNKDWIRYAFIIAVSHIAYLVFVFYKLHVIRI